MVSSGVSSCSSRYLMPFNSGKCAARRALLAPGATVMAFSALSDTQINAVPVGSLSSRTMCRSTSAALSDASIGTAKLSRPSASNIAVGTPPARAHAIAWLAPLPPANVRKLPPSTVSPGAGMCGARTTKSRLAEPATRIIESL